MKRFLIFTASALCSLALPTLTTADLPVAAYQTELLDLAFDGVSKMPQQPHLKNRSRAQLVVADAGLSLGLSDRASAYLLQIENWQRWMGQANLAYFYAEQGQPERAATTLIQVEAVLKTVVDKSSGKVLATSPTPLVDTLTGWRFNQVKTRVFETCAVMDRIASASMSNHDLNGNLIPSIQVDQTIGDESDYEGAMVLLRQIAANQNFEIVHEALLGMARLADTYYDELDFPRWIDAEIIPHFAKTPVFMRTAVLEQLANVALRHDDRIVASGLCDDVQRLLENANLPVRYRIPEYTELLTIRFAIGERIAAEAILHELEAVYFERQALIVNMERAKLLCKLAESNELLGFHERALEVYAQALEAGQINPNGRPQADDLCAICCSIALHNVEPSPALLQQLREMNNQLGAPW